MTPIADMVERMLTENAPAAAIVAAVRALEGITLVTLSSRDASRLQSRVRSKRYRENHKKQGLKEAAKANDVAERHAIVTRDASSNAVVLSSLLTTEETLKESKRERMRARGTRMAPGTPLSDEHRAMILSEGIRDPEKFWAEFVDYWSEVPGTRGMKIGWTGTLRNRCRDVIKHNRGQGNGRRTVHDAARDLSENIRKLMEPPPDGLCDGTGPSPLRLISQRRRE